MAETVVEEDTAAYAEAVERPSLPGGPSKLKKWSTYVCMALFFLAGGIEYSVVFPTLLEYLESKGGHEWLYGVTLAGFSISNLVTAPLYGVVFDKTHQTKMIVLFANLFEIGGNFMYFTAQNKYMIMGSRFVIGLGAGAAATLFGELARTTKKELRTTVFSIFMGMRQIGLVIGPAFNLFLAKSNFKVGPFWVTRLTVPGVFMVIVWVLMEVLFLFLFFSLPTIPDTTQSEPSDSPASDHTPSSDHILINSMKPSEGGVPSYQPPSENFESRSSNESTPLLSKKNPAIAHSSAPTYYTEGVAESGSGRGWCSQLYHGIRWRVLELMKEELVVLLAILFNTMFNQTAIETMFVPLAQNLLDWHEEKISIFFSVAGVEIIMCFVMVSILSKFVNDRYQIIFGLSVELLAYTWMVALIGNATSETPWILARLLVSCILALFGLPFFLVTSAALYSKLLPLKIQGFGQGIRRSIFSVAAILGPLWAGGSVSVDYYVLMGVPLGLLVLVLIMMLLSFPKLKEAKKRQ